MLKIDKTYFETYVIPTGRYAGMTYAERFWKLVNRSKSGCWEWLGKTDGNLRSDGIGYGIFRIGCKPVQHLLAHRVAYTLCVGPIESKSLVLHDCDNPKCVRPFHLYLGTTKDNSYDALIRNRFKPSRGSKNWRAKLTEEVVREIRQRYKRELITHEQLANEFGISTKQITVIINKIQWRHVA